MYPALPSDLVHISKTPHDWDWTLYVYSKKECGWLGIATYRSEREARNAATVIRALLGEVASTSAVEH